MDRAKEDGELTRQGRLLKAINSVFQDALVCKDHRDIANACLAAAEELTGSKFGFIGEMNPSGLFDTIAFSDSGWSACRLNQTNAALMIKELKIRGIWGAVIKTGEPLLVNDPDSFEGRVGRSEGHPTLTSFLGIPLKKADETVGMIALANKTSGYSQTDLDDMVSLSTAFVEVLDKKRTEEALHGQREQLKHLTECSPFGISITNKDLVFEYVNPRFTELLGYTIQDLPDKNIWFKKSLSG